MWVWFLRLTFVCLGEIESGDRCGKAPRRFLYGRMWTRLIRGWKDTDSSSWQNGAGFVPEVTKPALYSVFVRVRTWQPLNSRKRRMKTQKQTVCWWTEAFSAWPRISLPAASSVIRHGRGLAGSFYSEKRHRKRLTTPVSPACQTARWNSALPS